MRLVTFACFDVGTLVGRKGFGVWLPLEFVAYEGAIFVGSCWEDLIGFVGQLAVLLETFDEPFAGHDGDVVLVRVLDLFAAACAGVVGDEEGAVLGEHFMEGCACRGGQWSVCWPVTREGVHTQ